MPARGPYAKGLAKREEIIETAMAVYAENGYDRTSIREIARRSNITQAGLLHHFSSKEELFIEVLRRRDARIVPPFDGVRHRSHSVAALNAAVDRNEGEPDLVRLFVNMSAESTGSGAPSRAYFEQRYSWLRREIATDIADLQERGEFSDSYAPEDVATILIAVADGLQLQWLLDSAIGMSSHLDRLWDMLQHVPREFNPITEHSVSSLTDGLQPEGKS